MSSGIYKRTIYHKQKLKDAAIKKFVDHPELKDIISKNNAKYWSGKIMSEEHKKKFSLSQFQSYYFVNVNVFI